MEYEKIVKISDIYIDYIKNLEEYKKYDNLANVIKNNYSAEIKSFIDIKQKYINALEYSNYYPGFSKIKENYIKCKTMLFSNNLVKEYLYYKNYVENLINLDFKNIINSIKIGDDL